MEPQAFEEWLAHYGMPRRSGRYPWGSGEDPYQRSKDFVSRYNEYEKQGMSHEDILKAMGMKSTEYRALNAIAIAERRAYDVQRAEALKADGLNNTQIAKAMGFNSESSVRTLLDEGIKNRQSQSMELANRLKDAVTSKGIVQVGVGVERELNTSMEKMKVAEEMLKTEGYNVYPFRVPQVNNPGKWTTMKVLAPPGVEYQDVYKAAEQGKISTIIDYETVANNPTAEPKRNFQYPASMDSKRVKIRYADEKDSKGYTGDDRDGLIEIRPGVADLDLGKSRYAQVRILVDGTHYMKGMAAYSDNIPEGYDVVFNTNKKSNVPMGDVFKKIKSDPDNPFGSYIKEDGQSEYIDPKTGKKKLSLINKTREEGEWDEWSKNLPSQFLGKQNISLIEKQIAISLADRKAEYEEIKALNNPTVKKQLLQSYAEDCDAAASCLKAAALPRQRYQVIIPVPSLKDNEVYAPNFKDGEVLSLVRFPHGSISEIPQLRVNNKNKEARALVGTNPLDAVCVNKRVADRLSGADYDGDTVMVIPTNSKVKISAMPQLEGLKGFDSKSYKYDEVKTVDGTEHYYRNGKEFRIMKDTQKQMGVVSNLITDMTIKGANTDEIARAIRHSMVVIDAEKHKLDYKQSELDNDIKSLKQKYQDGGGASTLLSKAGADVRIDRRQGQPKINQKGKDWYDPGRPEGALIYKTVPDSELYYTTKKVNKKTGAVTEVVNKRHEEVSRMSLVDDANALSSGSPKEKIYADYANQLKSMANKARIEYTKTGKIAYSKAAKEKYKNEVKDLEDQLDIALKNAPREKQAQLVANSVARAKRADNPSMSKEDYKKISQQALTAARNRLGAHKEKIKVSDSQWEAIQAGAISENTLKKILLNMDSDDLRKRATPKQESKGLSNARIAQIKAKAASGYTTDEIAKELGVSASTVREYLK